VETTDIVADLAAEHDALDEILDPLDADDWARPTSSPGWTVADQVGHLAYYDRTATTAMTDPDAFVEHLNEVMEVMAGGLPALDDWSLAAYRRMAPTELLTAWREGRWALIDAAGSVEPGARIPWYGPPMGPASFLTARLMETWAHGQDVAEALGVRREPTSRLAHVAHLGVRTRPWSYMNRGLMPPADPVAVRLVAPDGGTWLLGDVDADEYVAGSAEDFCLVVTQRRRLDETALETTPLAREWLNIAQAFAGPPTDTTRA
jgi:uncharacterized protein (TIGR03084 family)